MKKILIPLALVLLGFFEYSANSILNHLRYCGIEGSCEATKDIFYYIVIGLIIATNLVLAYQIIQAKSIKLTVIISVVAVLFSAIMFGPQDTVKDESGKQSYKSYYTLANQFQFLKINNKFILIPGGAIHSLNFSDNNQHYAFFIESGLNHYRLVSDGVTRPEYFDYGSETWFTGNDWHYVADLNREWVYYKNKTLVWKTPSSGQIPEYSDDKTKIATVYSNPTSAIYVNGKLVKNDYNVFELEYSKEKDAFSYITNNSDGLTREMFVKEGDVPVTLPPATGIAVVNPYDPPASYNAEAPLKNIVGTVVSFRSNELKINESGKPYNVVLPISYRYELPTGLKVGDRVSVDYQRDLNANALVVVKVTVL